VTFFDLLVLTFRVPLQIYGNSLFVMIITVALFVDMHFNKHAVV